MRTFLLIFTLGLLFCSTVNAQDVNPNKEMYNRAKQWQERMEQVRSQRPQEQENTSKQLDNNQKRLPPPNRFDGLPNHRLPYYHNRWNRPMPPMPPVPPVGYFPVVQWYPYGTWMHVGPVIVSPDRRYVGFGISAGSSRYHGFETFNFRR